MREKWKPYLQNYELVSLNCHIMSKLTFRITQATLSPRYDLSVYPDWAIFIELWYNCTYKSSQNICQHFGAILKFGTFKTKTAVATF